MASRVGGIPELVKHKQTGLLVTPNMPDQLADSILILAKDRKLRESMGEKAKLLANTEFNSKKIIGDHLQIYLSCCKRP